MSRFLRDLALAQKGLPRGRGGRRWVFVPYDQLSDRIGPLSREDPGKLGIILIECPRKASLRPYHRQKLVLVLSSLRHFALEQARRGVAVRHVVAPGSYGEALVDLARELGTIRCMEPAERELREELRGVVKLLPHEGWLTTREQFLSLGPPPWRMEAFYRRVRRDSGILMEKGGPAGGKWSFDRENRLPWKGEPLAPEPPRFPPDPIKQEVAEMVATRYASHPGRIDLGAIPATRKEASVLLSWALREALPSFGPYEDAMSLRSRGLFHTRLSPVLNLHRILPLEALCEAAAADLPLPSREAFVRQILGWREFVRHVHRETEGFRDVPGNVLGADRPLPPAYWGASSGMRCLDEVVATVWEEGWSHHITRLMVLANIATLLDISPRALTDWFWAAYTDAYDWVVEPNVLGMGTFSLGDLFITKPYVSGASYLARMSDYCRGCAFDPRKDCPLTRLYWAFLARHEGTLSANPRLGVPYAALRARPAHERLLDRDAFQEVSRTLGDGLPVRPCPSS